MPMSRSFLLRQALLTGLFAVTLGTSPALARNFNANTDHESKDSLGEIALPSASTEAPPANVDPMAASAFMPTDAALMASGFSDSMANFGPSSGTVVGNRAMELRDEVLRLRASVNLNSNQFSVLRSGGAAGAVQYHSTVAAITARLQNGTTRGNPILLRQWDEANGSLDEVTSSLNRLNSLLTAIDSDSSVAAYLQQSIDAGFELSGAVDEDHDQLKLLKDEVSRLIVQLDYLRTQTSSDIQRQTSYVASERSNLQTLAFAISRGELMGNSLANRPIVVSPPVSEPTPSSFPLMEQPRAVAPTAMPVPMAPVPTAAPAQPVTQSSYYPSTYAIQPQTVAPIAAIAPAAPAPVAPALTAPATPAAAATMPLPAPNPAGTVPAGVPDSAAAPVALPTPQPSQTLSTAAPQPTLQPAAAPVSPVAMGVVGKAAPMSPRDYMAETATATSSTSATADTSAKASAAASPLGRLLVLIRFNQPRVAYEQQLSQAVGKMIETRPNSEFMIVAVSPNTGDATDLAKGQETAKKNAEDVKRTLIQLGLSPSRLTLANTATQAAQVPEVHVYVR